MANTHITLTGLFTDIANKIRLKKGTTASIKADDFPSEIESIQTGITPSGSQTFTENGTFDVTALAQAIINVSGGGDAPEIAWGTARPNADLKSIDIDTGLTDVSVTPYIIIVASSDVRQAYKILGWNSRSSEVLRRSYNTNIDTSNKAAMSMPDSFANGVYTLQINHSSFTLIDEDYYWFAIPLFSDATSFAMP